MGTKKIDYKSLLEASERKVNQLEETIKTLKENLVDSQVASRGNYSDFINTNDHLNETIEEVKTWKKRAEKCMSNLKKTARHRSMLLDLICDTREVKDTDVEDCI